MRILLVEDNDDHRELMCRALTEHDLTWQIDGVVSGEEALRHLAEGETYELVFLDYRLPGRDGLELLKEIRRGEAPPLVVMVTGRGDEQVAVEAMKCGVYDYVVKSEGYLQRLPVVAQRAMEVHQLAADRKRVEEALRESHERYSQLANSITDVFFAFDKDLKYTYWNAASEKLTKISAEEAIGKSLYDLFPDTPQTRIAEKKYREVLKTGISQTFVNEYKIGGKDYYFEISAYPSRDGISVFNKEITERKRTEEALRRAEENFRHSLDDSPLGVRIVTMKGETVYANRAILDIYGYDSIEELRTTPLKRRYTPESYTEQQIRMEKRNRGEYDPSEYEISIIRKNGEVRHLQVFRKEVLWNGERQFQVIYRDITERKKAEEKIAASLREKEVLLREIHHRVKNNLQIVSSLLRLQSRFIEDEKMREIFNESQSRIRSMSLIHEKLYESKDFSRIDFSDYIGKMVTHLFVVYRVNTGDVRFKVEAKGIHLDITKAIPCGLIINELVSNALKYAFAEGKKGDLIIRMNKDKSGKYHLSVKNTGTGVPPDFDIRKTETLGFQIVNDLVRQISGTIELKMDKGTEFRIVF